MAGWGNLFGKIADQFQGRIERLKNEKTNLEKEKGEIERLNLDINKVEDRKKAERLDWVIDRINTINGLLVNKAA